MALTTLDSLVARVRNTLPNNSVAADDLRTDNLLADIVVQASHQVHTVAHCGQSGTLSRSWEPLGLLRDLHINSEAFTLLHALDVGLESSDKLIHKLVPGDVLSWVGMELLILLLIT